MNIDIFGMSGKTNENFRSDNYGVICWRNKNSGRGDGMILTEEVGKRSKFGNFKKYPQLVDRAYS